MEAYSDNESYMSKHDMPAKEMCYENGFKPIEYNKDTDLVQPFYKNSNSYETNLQEDILISQLKLDTSIKSKVRDENENAQENQAQRLSEEVNLIHTSHKEVSYQKNIASEINDVRNKSNQKSHRWGKTKKSRLRTSSEKMTKANNIIGEVKNIKCDDILEESKLRLAKYGEFYDEVRSADRYLAEAVSKNKIEEKMIKAQADMINAKNKTYLCTREILRLNTKRNLCQDSIKDYEERIKQIKDDNPEKFKLMSYLEELKETEKRIGEKVSEFTQYLIPISTKLNADVIDTEIKYYTAKIENEINENPNVDKRKIAISTIEDLLKSGGSEAQAFAALKPYLDKNEDARLINCIERKDNQNALGILNSIALSMDLNVVVPREDEN